MQNINFGKLYIPQTPENNENINAITPSRETKKSAITFFNKLEKKSADKDVFLYVDKACSTDPKSQTQESYFVSVEDKEGNILTSTIITSKDKKDVNHFNNQMTALVNNMPNLGNSQSSLNFLA